MKEENSSKLFINKIQSSPQKRFYETIKTIIKSIDDTLSSDLLDMNDYGPSNNKQHSNSLVLIDKFSKCVWTIPLKNKNAQTITDVFAENK